MNKQAKTVTMIVTEHTFIEGKLVEQGAILRDMEPDAAYNLAGAGKARVATDADLEAAAKAAKKPADKPAA